MLDALAVRLEEERDKALQAVDILEGSVRSLGTVLMKSRAEVHDLRRQLTAELERLNDQREETLKRINGERQALEELVEARQVLQQIAREGDPLATLARGYFERLKKGASA